MADGGPPLGWAAFAGERRPWRRLIGRTRTIRRPQMPYPPMV
jgi:hypothetical protein